MRKYKNRLETSGTKTKTEGYKKDKRDSRRIVESKCKNCCCCYYCYCIPLTLSWS